MDVKEIAIEYSKLFISDRYKEKFAEGLFGLERNWVGPVKDNDGIYETLKLFQEMEKNATPQDKLNWRFQQGLYRAYYDAYVKARLQYETDLETQAVAVLKKAKEIGAIKAIDEAEAILDKAVTQKVKPEWHALARGKSRLIAGRKCLSPAPSSAGTKAGVDYLLLKPRIRSGCAHFREQERICQ